MTDHGKPAFCLLPPPYQKLLKQCRLDESVQLYSEAQCRNQGKYNLRRFLRSDGQPGRLETCYQQRGFTVFDKDHSGALHLMSDFYLSGWANDVPPFEIGITRAAKRPTCALILAGKYILAAKSGYTFCIWFYAQKDDERIRRKLKVGALAAACLRERDLDLTFLIYTVRSTPPGFTLVSDLTTAAEATPCGHKRSSAQGLISRTYRKTKQSGEEYEKNFCSDTCNGIKTATETAET